MTVPESGLLTQREAVAYLRTNRNKVIAWTKDGSLPHVRWGDRGIRYRVRDLQEFIDSRVQRGGA